MQRIIAYMNTKAVGLFEMGENEGAVALLRDVVSLLVQSRLVVPGNDSKLLLPSESPVMMICSNFVLAPCHSPLVPGENKEIDCTDDDIDFFPHPFLFELSPRSEGINQEDFTHDEFAFATAACLYNVALVHHRSWVSSKRNDDSQLLNRVFQLYYQAFHVLVSWNPEPAAAAGGNSTIILLTMALCKNLASISYEYGDLVQVKVWQSHLDRAMRFADPRLFDRETYSFFRISTMLRGTEIIAARAA